MAYIQLSRVSEGEAISSLLFFLTGTAQLWFANLEPFVKQSLQSIKQAFMTRFQPSSKLNLNLMDVEQGQQESVEDYIYRVLAATSDRTVSNDWLIHVITQGLRDKIQDAVAQRDPQTLEELRDAAQKAENSEKLQRRKRAKEAEINAVQQRQYRRTAPQMEPAPTTTQTPARPCGRCGRSCVSPQTCFANDKTCYFCNGKHHLYQVCRRREADIRNGGSGELKYRPARQQTNVSA